MYVHGDDTIPFWEGASLEWSKQYCSAIRLEAVRGRRGVVWIGRYRDFIPRYCRDCFHLSTRMSAEATVQTLVKLPMRRYALGRRTVRSDV